MTTKLSKAIAIVGLTTVMLLFAFSPSSQGQDRTYGLHQKAVSVAATYASHNSTVYYFVLFDDGHIERYFIGPVSTR